MLGQSWENIEWRQQWRSAAHSKLLLNTGRQQLPTDWTYEEATQSWKRVGLKHKNLFFRLVFLPSPSNAALGNHLLITHIQNRPFDEEVEYINNKELCKNNTKNIGSILNQYHTGNRDSCWRCTSLSDRRDAGHRVDWAGGSVNRPLLGW